MLNLVRVLSFTHLISFPVIIKRIASKKIIIACYYYRELIVLYYFVCELNSWLLCEVFDNTCD